MATSVSYFLKKIQVHVELLCLRQKDQREDFFFYVHWLYNKVKRLCACVATTCHTRHFEHISLYVPMFKVVVHDFFGINRPIYILILFHFVQYAVYNIVLSCHTISRLSREFKASQLCQVTACQTSVQKLKKKLSFFPEGNKISWNWTSLASRTLMYLHVLAETSYYLHPRLYCLLITQSLANMHF